jgi:CheY-like chemotaxis protein
MLKFFLLLGYFTAGCFPRRILLHFCCIAHVVQPQIDYVNKHNLIWLQFQLSGFDSGCDGVFMKAKKTILCVDDNEQLLSVRKVILETRGYRVLDCSNGRKALEVFKQGGVDLVLSDLAMPEFDGVELIDAVKSLSPGTPAILFSGKVKIYERETRADIFLPKGTYRPAELLEHIRLLLVRKRGPKKSVARAALASPMKTTGTYPVAS